MLFVGSCVCVLIFISLIFGVGRWLLVAFVVFVGIGGVDGVGGIDDGRHGVKMVEGRRELRVRRPRRSSQGGWSRACAFRGCSEDALQDDDC